MSTVAVELDEVLATLLRETCQPIQLAASEMIVLELYRRGAISSGKPGDLLGMPRMDFIRHASELGIPVIDMTAEEWEQEKATVTAWPEWGSGRNRN